jgi:hypothetical protein
VAALFWIDPADPKAGGTGHTIRVATNNDISGLIFDQIPLVIESLSCHSSLISPSRAFQPPDTRTHFHG